MVCAAADAHVIELARLCSQASFDVAQVFAVGKLRERHAEILIEERKRFDFVFAPVTRYPATKRNSGRCSMICANTSLPMAIDAPCECSSQDGKYQRRSSNRDRNKTSIICSVQSVAVEQSIEWDTTGLQEQFKRVL